MQVEFLEDGAPDCPLIRIYGTHPAEFSSLHQAFRQLANTERESYLIHELPAFVGVSSCSLTIASGIEKGVQQLDHRLDFEWTLSSAKWALVAGLVEPFTLDPRDGTYQWLCGKEARYGLDVGSISVLLSCSKDGRW